MTCIVHEDSASLEPLRDAAVAVVGYGNQGRPWALNLRDAGLDVTVCVRADDSRRQAEADGFPAQDVSAASGADVICILVPDDAIPTLPLAPAPGALVVVASGYTLAFDRFAPACDVGMVAPRMLGPEVRRCYEEGVGFITAFGVHQDSTGHARARTLAVAMAIGGLRQGAIEMSPRQEAVLDLAVEQALSPALRRVTEAFVQVMLEQDIPLEAILTELVLSGEIERTYRLLRLDGYAAQMEHHSPVSQYGQLSRGPEYEHLDVAAPMRRIVERIDDGRFADEWDAEVEAGLPNFTRLKAAAVGPEVVEFERELRRQLGEGAVSAAGA
jgi:ketol-acid reductoisomerase